MDSELNANQDPTELPRSEMVFRALRDDILNLRLSPDERIYESVVAERFEASRTPVREALQRLFADGLLLRKGRSYVLPEITFKFVNDLYLVREALECKALELFVQNNGSLDGVWEPLEKMQHAVDHTNYEDFIAADIEFHVTLIQSAKNSFLEGLLTTVWNRVTYVRNVAFRNPQRLESSIQEHRRIVSALERGNVVIAVEEMRIHLSSVPQLLISSL